MGETKFSNSRQIDSIPSMYFDWRQDRILKIITRRGKQCRLVLVDNFQLSKNQALFMSVMLVQQGNGLEFAKQETFKHQQNITL